MKGADESFFITNPTSPHGKGYTPMKKLWAALLALLVVGVTLGFVPGASPADATNGGDGYITVAWKLPISSSQWRDAGRPHGDGQNGLIWPQTLVTSATSASPDARILDSALKGEECGVFQVDVYNKSAAANPLPGTLNWTGDHGWSNGINIANYGTQTGPTGSFWKFVDRGDCSVEVTPSVNFTPASCVERAPALVPEVNTAQWSFVVTGPDEARVVSFTAAKGFKLTQSVFGPYDTTVLPVRDCTEYPGDDVQYTNWEDGEFACGDELVVTTRTKTTTPLLWNEQTEAYDILDTENAVTVGETDSRLLTDEERITCVTPTAPFVTPSDACDVPATLTLPYIEGIYWVITQGENTLGRTEDYVVAPNAGTVEVTAKVLPGFDIVGESVFTVDVPEFEECPPPVVEEPPVEEPPVTSPPVVEPPAEVIVVPVVGTELPKTGTTTAILLAIAAALIVLGAGLVATGRVAYPRR